MDRCLNRGRKILAGLASHPWPVLSQKSGLRRIDGWKTVNLLSPDGEKLLAKLTGADARKYLQKHNFDLSLVRDFGFDYESILARTGGKPAWVSILPVAGCVNNCAHCCENAAGPVYSMPYPLLLAARKAVRKVPVLQVGDSEALSYCDSLFSADLGDLYLHESQKGNRDKIHLLFKGVGSDAASAPSRRALRKITELRRPLKLQISLPMLDKEDIGENMNRARRAVEIIRKNRRLAETSIVLMGRFADIRQRADEIIALGAGIEFSQIAPIGRALSLPPGIFNQDQRAIKALFAHTGRFMEESSPLQAIENNKCLDAFGIVRNISMRPVHGGFAISRTAELTIFQP
ncbi:MAG: hypothetical protein FWF01_01800 [Alphaproteobacteria bacterium]|nr:hypothetical protein [Alphaproteobacteria bacterium]